MKMARYLALAMALLQGILPWRSQATHSMGADMYYEWISDSTYKFTLRFYRDCAGIPAPAAVTFSLVSPSACFPNNFINLVPVGSGLEVSPLCPTALPNSTCAGCTGVGCEPGVEMYVYEGTYTLPRRCADWQVSFQECCRNNMITNLVSPGTVGMYIQMELNASGTLHNSSPVFTTLPVPYICALQSFCYNHGAWDPDGDSLVYSLVNALNTSPSTPIPYVAPATATYPILTVSGSVTFDPATGSMCVVPNGPQVAVVTIRVDEYRGGVKIGSTMRDLQIVVQTCSNAQPLMSSGGIVAIAGGTIIDSNSVQVCPGSLLTFDIIFTDPNPGDAITITDNLSTTIPAASGTQTGTNPATFHFSWTPTALDAGLHTFTVSIQDNGCPVLGAQVYSFDIRVLTGTYAGPDRGYCPSGGPVPITATGGSTFTWSVLSGTPGSLSCIVCPTTYVSPLVPTLYEVVSDLVSSCNNRDTVLVSPVPDFILDAGPNDTICKYGAITLPGSATPASLGPFTWNWSPASTLSSTSIANPIANPLTTTTYYVSAVSADGCTITDSVRISVIGEAPLVNATGTDTICPGTSKALGATYNYLCGTSTATCGSGPFVGTVGASVGTSFAFGPFNFFVGNFYTHRKQYIYRKADLDAMGFAGGGKISAIAINIPTPGAAPNTNGDVTIKMGCTSLTAFTTTSFVPGLSVVKNSFSWTPVAGWNTVTLDNAYYWDGVSNLIVEFCTSILQAGNFSSISYQNPGFNCGINLNNFNVNGSCGLPTGTITNSRPWMRFTYCPLSASGITISWTPSGGLSNPAILNPIATPTSTTTYLLNVSDGSCTGSDYVTITIDSTIYAEASATPSVICPGETTPITTAITGTALPTSLPCGANGTVCTKPNHAAIVGTGTAGNNLYGPFYGFGSGRYSNKVQYIYTAAELVASGMAISGTISQISLNITSSNAEKYKEFTISIGCTAASQFTTTSFITGLTPVLAPLTFTTSSGWNTFNITPFDWNGTSNLVVQMCSESFNNATTFEDVAYSTTVGVNRCNYYHLATTSSVCAQLTGTLTTNRPNMIFTVCDAPDGTLTYSWSPSAGLSSTTIPNPIASPTTTTTYTVTVTGGVCTVTDTVTITMCGPLAPDDWYFEAQRSGEQVKLEWETLQEQGLDYFEVWHTTLGVSWDYVGSTAAHGGGQDHAYQLLHVNPSDGWNYYRLRIFGKDGSMRETEGAEVYFEPGGDYGNLWPNPLPSGTGPLHLDWYAEAAGELNLRLFDLQGRKIWEQSHRFMPGEQEFEIPVAHLSQGQYLLILSSPRKRENHRVIIR